MARKEHRPQATYQQTLIPQQIHCPTCGGSFWVAYRTRRTILTLDGLCQLTLAVRRCHNSDCPRYHVAYRPEEEGRWALPPGEFGLDVIALIGSWRFAEHRSVPEIHQRLQSRSIQIAERTVLNLVQRYEELVTLHLSNQQRLNDLLTSQGRVILALDGLQPDVGHEVRMACFAIACREKFCWRVPYSAVLRGSGSSVTGSQSEASCPRARHHFRWARNDPQRCRLRLSGHATSTLPVSLVSVMPLSRSSRRIGMRKPFSKVRSEGFDRLSALWRSETTRKRRPFVTIAWRG